MKRCKICTYLIWPWQNQITDDEHDHCYIRRLADKARDVKIPRATKLVYIAGPYTGVDLKAVDNNIQLSRSAAVELARNGIGFISPCLNSAHFESMLGADDPGYEFWIRMTMEMLKRCDAIFMVPGWETSRGARAEFAWASANGMPVFVVFESLKEWYFK